MNMINPSVTGQAVRASQQQVPSQAGDADPASNDVSDFQKAMEQATPAGPSNEAAAGQPQATPPMESASGQQQGAGLPPATSAGAPSPGMAAPPPAAAGEASSADSKPASIGDSILQGLKEVSQNYTDEMKDLQNTTDDAQSKGWNPIDMLKVQADAAEITVQQDITSKVADSASQGIQTLFKNQ